MYLCKVNKTNTQKLNDMTTATKYEIAIQLVIIDAIERGLTTAAEAVEYMATDIFLCQVENYVTLIESEF